MCRALESLSDELPLWVICGNDCHLGPSAAFGLKADKQASRAASCQERTWMPLVGAPIYSTDSRLICSVLRLPHAHEIPTLMAGNAKVGIFRRLWRCRHHRAIDVRHAQLLASTVRRKVCCTRSVCAVYLRSFLARPGGRFFIGPDCLAAGREPTIRGSCREVFSPAGWRGQGTQQRMPGPTRDRTGAVSASSVVLSSVPSSTRY